MNFITNIRFKIGNYFIDKRFKKKSRSLNACNISEAKTALIICDSVNEANFAACKNLESFLKENNVEYQIVGFNNTKTVMYNVISDSTHHFIDKKAFNWYFLPKAEEINQLIDKEFDLLFNLYEAHSIEVEALVKSSRAKFKLGTAHFNSDIHDLMLEIDEKNKQPDYIVTQMQHYISVINA